MRSIFIAICFSCFILMACNEHSMNTKAISVKGCVTDSSTGKPVPNARVNILCWYHAGWDKTDYVSIDTVANENGCFNATFEEGYKVVVASIATNYLAILGESDKVSVKPVEINLKLKQGQSRITPIEKFNLRDYIVQNSSN